MKCKIITIESHYESEYASQICIQSSEAVGNNFEVELFNAIIPENVNKLLLTENIKWTYPEVHTRDFRSGLTLHPYVTSNKNARIACGLSHYFLWKECLENNQPYLILEHDAEFILKLDYQYILDSRFDIVGLNDPRGATRMSHVFYDTVINSKTDILPVPIVDNTEVPQGLAGNSAYIIKPSGARKMLDAVIYYGLWPNDALMCRQLIPGLGVTKKFYTRVQKMEKSTTRD